MPLDFQIGYSVSEEVTVIVSLIGSLRNLRDAVFSCL